MNRGVIVCVDDERFVLLSLRDQLTRILGNTYTIELAETGREALGLFAELREAQIPVPVIICDQTMLDMQGDELLGQLHLQYPSTRKILLTGVASLEDVVNVVNRASLYRYIAKPWDEADLSLTVQEALRSYWQEHQLREQYVALAQSERQLLQFLEAMPVAVGVLDRTGRPYYVNRKAQQLLGKGVLPEVNTEQISTVYQLYRAGTAQLYPVEDLPIVRALNGQSFNVDDMEIW